MPSKKIGAKPADFSQLYAAARFSLSPDKLATEVTRLLCIPDCCTSRGLKHCHTSFEMICATLDEVFFQCRENPECAVSNRLAAAVIVIYGYMGVDTVLRMRIFAETVKPSQSVCSLYRVLNGLDFLPKAMSLLPYSRPGETVMRVLSDLTHSHDIRVLLDISRFTTTILDAVEDLSVINVNLNYAEKAVCVLTHVTGFGFLDSSPDSLEVITSFPRLIDFFLAVLRRPSSSPLCFDHVIKFCFENSLHQPEVFLANTDAVDFLVACTRSRDICVRIAAQQTLIGIYATQVEERPEDSLPQNPVLVQARAPQVLEEYYRGSQSFSARHFDGLEKFKALADAFNSDAGRHSELGVELAGLLSDRAILIRQYKLDIEGGKEHLIGMLRVCEDAVRNSVEADAEQTADILHLLGLLTYENGPDTYDFARTCIDRHPTVAFFYYVVAICGNRGFDCVLFADKGLECSGMSDCLRQGLLHYYAPAALEMVSAMVDGAPERVRFGEMNVLLEKASRSAKTFIDIAALDDPHIPVMHAVDGLLDLAANGHAWKDADFQPAADKFSLVCDISRCTDTGLPSGRECLAFKQILARMPTAWQVWGRTVSRRPSKQYSTEVRAIMPGPAYIPGSAPGDLDSEPDPTANLAALLNIVGSAPIEDHTMFQLHGVQPGGQRYGTAQLHCCATCNRPSATLRKCAGCRQVRYCDDICQKKGWKLHRDACKASRAASD